MGCTRLKYPSQASNEAFKRLEEDLHARTSVVPVSSAAGERASEFPGRCEALSYEDGVENAVALACFAEPSPCSV